jgi:hypothetical protein
LARLWKYAAVDGRSKLWRDRLEGGRLVGFLVRRSDGKLHIVEAYRALNVVQSDIQHLCAMGDPAD